VTINDKKRKQMECRKTEEFCQVAKRLCPDSDILEYAYSYDNLSYIFSPNFKATATLSLKTNNNSYEEEFLQVPILCLKDAEYYQTDCLCVRHPSKC
jgi:hypothetical protein